VFVNCFTCQGNAAISIREHRNCAKMQAVLSRRDKGLQMKSGKLVRRGGLKTAVKIITGCSCARKNNNNNKKNVTLFGCVCR